MRPDRVSNPGPLTYESGALPTALRGPALSLRINNIDACICINFDKSDRNFLPFNSILGRGIIL